jgi:hypothetical protein
LFLVVAEKSSSNVNGYNVGDAKPTAGTTK